MLPQARHVQHSYTIQLGAPADQSFPLFTPTGEAQWAPGWSPHFLYPTSGETAVGTTFITHSLVPDGSDTYWMLSAFDPAQHHLTYARITPNALMGLVDIRCVDVAPDASRATVSYTFTSLGVAGDAFLDQFTAHHYQQEMLAWERAINHYLQTGHTLSHH